MTKNILSILLLTFLWQNTSAQKQTIAVLLETEDNSEKYSKIITSKISKTESAFDNIKFLYYDWEEGKSLKAIEHEDVIPPTHIYFVDIRKDVIERPDLQLLTDTLGNTIQAFYVVSASLRCHLKLLELKTTEVLHLSTLTYATPKFGNSGNNSMMGRNSLFDEPFRIVIDFKKEFKEDPAKLQKANPKEFNKLEEALFLKVKKVYTSKLEKTITSWGTQIGKKVELYARTLENKSYKILTKNVEDTKIKEVKSNITSNDGYSVDDWIAMYETMNTNGRFSYNNVCEFRVTEIDSLGSTLRIEPFGDKQRLAELVNSDAEIILSNNERPLLNRLMRENASDVQNVSIKKECINCSMGLQMSLTTIPTIRLLERADFEFKHFREIMKLENNIGAMSDDQYYKSVGVRYIFYNDGDKLQTTDLVTGRVLGSQANESKLLGIKFSDTTSPYIIKTLLHETFDKNIEMTQVLDESKKSIKEISLYSPFGLLPMEAINVYGVDEEQVNGKKLLRKTLVAECYVVGNINKQESRVKVRKGGRDLKDLLEIKKPLVFEYRINNR
jgi:hypothetical protein